MAREEEGKIVVFFFAVFLGFRPLCFSVGNTAVREIRRWRGFFVDVGLDCRSAAQDSVVGYAMGRGMVIGEELSDGFCRSASS